MFSNRACLLLQGSDQIRQAFSKRKKGLVLKAYQLYRLTDAKVRGQQAAGSRAKLLSTKTADSKQLLDSMLH
jgi:hypothetical protein